MSFAYLIVALILIGILMAFIDRNYLRPRDPDLYVLISEGMILGFWILSGLIYWGVIPILALEQIPFPFLILTLLSYPLWYMWGVERGRQIFGRTKYQLGVRWLLKLVE